LKTARFLGSIAFAAKLGAIVARGDASPLAAPLLKALLASFPFEDSICLIKAAGAARSGFWARVLRSVARMAAAIFSGRRRTNTFGRWHSATNRNKK